MHQPSLYLLASGRYNKSEIMRRALARARGRVAREREPATEALCRRMGYAYEPVTFRVALAAALKSEWAGARAARSFRDDAPVEVHPAYIASCMTDGRLQVAL
jgi:hypothetical protein